MSDDVWFFPMTSLVRILTTTDIADDTMSARVLTRSDELKRIGNVVHHDDEP